jgi:hypothetical protein
MVKIILFIKCGFPEQFHVSIVILKNKIETMTQTEKQKYSVLHKDGNFEIRPYEPAIMASVQMPGSYSNMSSTGFRELAGYIYGGNDEKMKITMTAPVHVSMADSTSIMSFVMP